ncbi:hypothetical protein ACWGIB_05890 [Streptomyces xiamenensis]
MDGGDGDVTGVLVPQLVDGFEDAVGAEVVDEAHPHVQVGAGGVVLGVLLDLAPGGEQVELGVSGAPASVQVDRRLGEVPQGTAAARPPPEQHLGGWDSNPANVERRTYGTDIRYRARVLATTPYPTLLSVRGGPFNLHTAPVLTDDGDTDDVVEESDEGCAVSAHSPRRVGGFLLSGEPAGC